MGLCSQHPQKGDLHPRYAEFQKGGTKSIISTQKRKNKVHITQKGENTVFTVPRVGRTVFIVPRDWG